MRLAFGRTRFFVALALSLISSGFASEIRIAAASDLKFALDELVASYGAARPGSQVKVSYGSSGNFFAQIRNGAPFDLYFSADLEYPRKLAEAGEALDGSVFLYGVGRIVLWVPNGSRLALEKEGMRTLIDPTVKKVAIANPQHAPYGRAAVAALKEAKIYEEVQPRLVFGENIAQTAQFVQTGNAEAGVIALGLALAPAMKDAGRYWEVPVSMYPRMEQGGIVLKRTKEPEAAKSFRDFVLSENGRALLKRYGFFLPESK